MKKKDVNNYIKRAYAETNPDMFAVNTIGYKDEVRDTKLFKAMGKAMKDYIANIVGCDLYADRVEVTKAGQLVGKVNCWELRDKALIDGYEFPVHRQYWEENEGKYITEWIREQREKALA